jgi:hypothetical protein
MDEGEIKQKNLRGQAPLTDAEGSVLFSNARLDDTPVIFWVFFT